jgi:L,D-peptidoglycan transpeptidase YkuD (ErfK/YbiS/YcfS/YnhG family)
MTPNRTASARRDHRGRPAWRALAATALAGVVLSGEVAASASGSEVASALDHSASVTAPHLIGAKSRSLPDVIGARPSVRQMITVAATSWSSNYATLKAWQRTTGGRWKLAHGPVKAVVGYNGWVVAEDRDQGTGTTPAGRFSIPYAFGRWTDPGAHVRYRRVDGNDWWPYEPRDPSTYNVYQFHKARKTHWRSDKAEHLDSYTRQYGYALVIGFNLPKGIEYSRERRQWVATEHAHIHRGGGIFLHVKGDGFTAGCVAIRKAHMKWLVRWIKPRAHTRVVMGPRSYLVDL